MRYPALALALLLAVQPRADAAERRGGRIVERAGTGDQLVPLTAGDVDSAERRFGLQRDQLWAVLSAEGGRVGECLANERANGRIASWDCGPFQINTGNIARLAKLLAWPVEEVRRRLRDDGPFNAVVAGYFRASAIRPGHYHSPDPARAEAYEARLDAALQRLRED